MTSPVITSSPTDRNSARGAVNLVGDVGFAVVDTLAQTSRFTSNLLSLDLEGALNNLGQVVSKRSIDELMSQFVENLPTVLEQDLDRIYRPSAEVAVGQYFTDSKLNPAETAAILNFALAEAKRQAQAQGKTLDTQKIILELKDAAALMRKGANNKSGILLGKELGSSMRAAIAAAPKPRWIIGNPMNAKRQVAIAKGFVHSLVQTQGVAYVRGTVAGFQAQARDAGVKMTGLSDSMIRATIDNAVDNLGIDACLQEARLKEDLLACGARAEKNPNKIIGSTLETLGPELKLGRLKITLDNPQFSQQVDIGRHLSDVLGVKASEVQDLEKTGSNSVLNKIINDTVSSTAREIGNRVVEAQAVSHFASSSESQAKVKMWGKVVVDKFTSRLRALEGGQEVVTQVEALLRSGPNGIADNPTLDRRLRGPFKETLNDAEVKAALLGIFLEKAPVTQSLRNDLLGAYSEGLRRLPISFKGNIPEALKGFLQNFDQAITKLSDVPPNSMTIKYLKGLIDLESTTLNKLIVEAAPNASSLFAFYLECKNSDAHCDSLQEPVKSQVALIRQAQAGTVGTSFEQTCKNTGPVLVAELFRGIDAMDRNVLRTPEDAILALASRRSQQSVDCLISGLAASRGIAKPEVERLHSVLSESLETRPEDRQELVESAHGYFKNPRTGGQPQKDLLEKTEAVSKDLAKDYVHKLLQEYASADNKGARIRDVFKNPENMRMTNALVDRMMKNTDLLDGDTPMPLKDYVKALAESPLSLGSPSDRSIQAGLRKTLRDPATRRDLLDLALGVDDALVPSRLGGLLGPGLEKRVREAYQRADLSGETARFDDSVSPGIQSFLKSFDTSLQSIDKHRKPEDSALKFFADMIKPESKTIDAVIAEQGKGASDLIMELVSQKKGNPNDLCGGCLGNKGSWLKVDPLTGTTEILAAAPVGYVLDVIRAGMTSGLDPAMNRICQAEIPKTIANIVAQPKANSNGPGVLQDPALFLDALSQVQNQTALNCILSNYAELKLLAKARVAFVDNEFQARELFAHMGVPGNPALYEVSAKTIFDALQKRSANPELLKRKADLVAKVKTNLKVDSRQGRHEVAVSLQDLTRSVLVGTLTDPEFSYGLVNGEKFPSDLRQWAEAQAANSVAHSALQCLDAHYTKGLMPVALFVGEDISRFLNQVVRPWVEDGPGSRVVRQAVPEATIHPLDAVEVCVSSGLLVSGGRGASDFAKPAPLRPGSVASPSLLTPNWVGGYAHTLEDAQELRRSEASPFLTTRGEQAVLKSTSDYQKLLNHIRTRQQIVGRGGGGYSAGDAIYEMKNAAPEAARAYGHLRSVVSFPDDKFIAALREYKASASERNHAALNALVSKNCRDLQSDWNFASRPSVRESERNHSN